MSSRPIPDREGGSATAQPILSSTAGLSAPRDGPSESSLTVEHLVHRWTAEELIRRRQGYVSMDTLPDEALLAIFAFFLCGRGSEEIWQTLVHVCRRWRSIVFASPRSLNLRIVCTSDTLVEELDVWPAFPLVIRVWSLCGEMDYNLLDAFNHSDRICEIYVDEVLDDGPAELASVMKDSFPKLKVLDIRSYERTESVPLLPDFLGGSAPCLRSLHLEGIAFPALPKLLLSVTGLVHLHLEDIPRTGFISPEAMADCLSRLTRLKQLRIEFRVAQPCPDQTR